MERILTLVGGRIIQRNRSDLPDIKTTQELDKLLLDGANLLPPKWWLTPDLTGTGCDDADALHETTRLMNQFAHYHLLARLHLPYLLHPSIDRTYDYNKITAVTASRELLSRFLSFRSAEPGAGSFCRGIDFLAFIASTALCLGHIDARLQHDRGVHDDGTWDDSAAFGYLVHQRLSDRGMMERVLDSMEIIGHTSPADLIATRIASILRHLLTVESNVANGEIYKRGSSREIAGEELECNGKMSDDGGVLRIFIPHLGTIKFERHGITKSVFRVPIAGEAAVNFTTSELSASLFGTSDSNESSSRKDDSRCIGDYSAELWKGGYNGSFSGGQWLDFEDDWTLQGVDVMLFDSMFPETERWPIVGV
jgi:hypothetical protein